MAAVSDPTIADLGEDGLLALLLPRLTAGASTLLGPGDDAAVVAAPDARVVVSTDVLVEGRHFRRDWSGGSDVGWRAAVQNLADAAAMGAVPTALTVALVCPPDLGVAWLLALADGLAQACAPDVGVVGGDLSGGDQVVVAVTVLADLGGRAPVLRSGARPGDVVAHAGVLGRSAAGLALLAAGAGVGRPSGRPGSAAPLAALVEAYRRPVAPLAAGVAAARAGASAMLDVSDGLLRDAGRIAAASGVTIELDDPAGTVPGDLAALVEAATLLGVDPTGWLLGGGEDHGMLATFGPDVALPEGFRRLGLVRERQAGERAGTVLVDGLAPTAAPGWDHFRR